MAQYPYNMPVAWSYYSQNGETAGVAIKSSAGVLHGFVVNSATSGAVVTIYDGTSTSGTVITTFTLGSVTTPQSLTQLDVPFKSGLFVAIATDAANLTFLYR